MYIERPARPSSGPPLQVSGEQAVHSHLLLKADRLNIYLLMQENSGLVCYNISENKIHHKCRRIINQTFENVCEGFERRLNSTKAHSRRTILN